MACVPKSGTVSHLSGRSPERVIHYEAISETGSDELTELPNTLATYMGPTFRHYARAGVPDHSKYNFPLLSRRGKYNMPEDRTSNVRAIASSRGSRSSRPHPGRIVTASLFLPPSPLAQVSPPWLSGGSTHSYLPLDKKA